MTVKTCVNCAFYQYVRTGKAEWHKCSAKVDNVTGRTVLLECYTARSKKYGSCGPTGKLFKAREAMADAAE